MAGSLPGIPLSQQFSAIGKPLAGCLLYVYAANSTTPQDSFQDQGLTIKNPWPLAADNSGRVPMFYLADGSVHVRLTDSTGVVQFDYPSMLVIGPSSGSGGGGGTGVDPTTIFQTGDCLWLEQSGSRTGWVRDNGRTIGNGVSGAGERANADCQNLYVFLWTNKSNTECPVTGGRGATGLADFNAGKQLQLPDKRGFAPCGDSAMGNADTGALASAPVIFGGPTISGSKLGEAQHKLAVAEAPTGLWTFLDPGHVHQYTQATNFGCSSNSPCGANAPNAQAAVNTGPAIPGSGGSGVNTGIKMTDNAGNGSHNITQLIVIGTFYRKL